MKSKAFIAVVLVGFVFNFLFQNCGKKKSYSPTSNKTSQSSTELDNPNSIDTEEDIDAAFEAAESACNSALINRFTAIDLEDQSRISSFKNAFYKAHNIAAIENGWGSVVISGYGVNPVVEEISGFKGNVILCGMSVESISNSSAGIISVVDADLGDIDSYKGVIVLLRGTHSGSVTRSNLNLLSLNKQRQFSQQIFSQ